LHPSLAANQWGMRYSNLRAAIQRILRHPVGVMRHFPARAALVDANACRCTI
jgi:hypothetical protein